MMRRQPLRTNQEVSIFVLIAEEMTFSGKIKKDFFV
ncbi:hypothetical protein Dtox_2096 [Desulfofarcimen acetoxidans DSM 771]|jgi:hypothetical protein|uniref:Uncharacterized protein n=1 Tax=Desulfofarcimen acetoxidans (strain ATCC 49208 / DSM 771 / KCTC 5769 / VKM B-1644 / 5575) TaxID=485916 RepID=C8VZ15_DESAS|nr:hypothetical protein Dtox_2096 [Desulfofarcimen acetoxidans DSM 771]